MIRFATQVATLTSAYVLTGDERYASHAIGHLRAWFVDEATRMAPHLRYAQAIKGRATGRGTGIIDTIHLVEVARSARLLESSRSFDGTGRPRRQGLVRRLPGVAHHARVRRCRARREEQPRHLLGDAGGGLCAAHRGSRRCSISAATATSACWCRTRWPQDGSFPLELKRTKPYGYSLFNLDAFAAICQILSTPSDDLWAWTTPDGRGIRRAVAFLYPYIKDKSAWPFAHDVMYFDQWPVRHPSLLFAGLALGEAALPGAVVHARRVADHRGSDPQPADPPPAAVGSRGEAGGRGR